MDLGTLKVTSWVKSKKALLKPKLTISIDLAMRMRAEMGSATPKHLFFSLPSLLVYSLCTKQATDLSVGKQRLAACCPFASASNPGFNCCASWAECKFKREEVSNRKPRLYHEHLLPAPR